jgi:3,4-dehydroadipyl-CoA semialdehyde dehydrogenase
MGALVSRGQFDGVQQGIAELSGEAEPLYDGRQQPLIDADPNVAACVAPVLLGVPDADRASKVHEHEVFGPVSTLIAYRDLDHAIALTRRGQGSLVTSIFSADETWMMKAALALAGYNGRVHMVNPEVGKSQTGHGNVMPASIHGGPGHAGGGEELGGLRGLAFYHRRCALQGPATALQRLAPEATAWTY